MERNNMKIIDTNFDVLTGETTTTERDETAAEIKERADRAAELAAEQAEAEAKAIQKAALLAKLGINDDEAKLLLS